MNFNNNPNNNNKKNNDDDNFFNKNPLLTFAIFSLVAIFFFKVLIGDSDQGFTENNGNSQVYKNKEITYSELKELVRNKEVTEVAIGSTYIKAKGTTITGQPVMYHTQLIHDPELIKLLDENRISYTGFNESNWFIELFGWLFPILLIMGLWAFLANRMQKSIGGGMLGLGNSKKLVNSEKPKTKFDDVAGSDEAKEEVKEIVDFLKFPQRYIELGAKIPKGVLLVGPPGTGKTLLAKAVAGEAEVPFYSVNGSSFIEMFVGVGAARVRDLFEQAKKDAPSIIFIDEIDAIGKSRAGNGLGGGNDEREQTLNQLLAEMDGFNSTQPIIILGATNRPETLDPALLRPGRFDRQVLVDKPDYYGRLEILKVHIKDVKLDTEIDLEEIAKLTAGLAGADLANIVNEAALLAGRKDQKTVKQKDLKEAVERAIAGLEKKSRRINAKEKKIVAYHESGHALISEITKGAKKVSKVSIVPRGLAALGYTLNTPEENRFLAQKHELIAEVDVLLGGRGAEEVFFNEISTGASNDLERATDIIKSMAQVYGMSDIAGLMVLEKKQQSFLGGGMSSRDYSEKIAEDLDLFIKETLNKRYTIVKQHLETYYDAIEKIVESLYETETISGKVVREIIENFEKENNLPSLLTPLEPKEKEAEEKEEERIQKAKENSKKSFPFDMEKKNQDNQSDTNEDEQKS
jgi:cell division protease FtsH